MRLDLLLVKRKLCESRQDAQNLIKKGAVIVNGAVQLKPSKDIIEESVITLTETKKYVSRGGEKLEGAFKALFLTTERVSEFLRGKNAIDVGSSTGGFTDFLLQHSILKVTAVDVGTDQLHTSLRGMPQISLFEKTDIRHFITEEKFDIIVADLSFIPLAHVIEKITLFAKAPKAYFFLLIKPQFEVGKGNTKKGIVKDKSLTDTVLNDYTELILAKGGQSIAVFPCAIEGGDGNQEYFLTFTL